MTKYVTIVMDTQILLNHITRGLLSHMLYPGSSTWVDALKKKKISESVSFLKLNKDRTDIFFGAKEE